MANSVKNCGKFLEPWFFNKETFFKPPHRLFFKINVVDASKYSSLVSFKSPESQTEPLPEAPTPIRIKTIFSEVIINKKILQRALVRRVFIINRMKNIQEVLKESPVSAYTGSEKTFDLVSKQIKDRWGEAELKNYDPFHNARTFRSWLSLGFRVRKGEKALKSVAFSEEKDADGNVIKRIPRAVFLFYYRQVEKINNK